MKKIRRFIISILIIIIKKLKLKHDIYFLLSNNIQRFVNSEIESGFLNQIGWTNSFYKKAPVDKNNNPLPWVSYSMIYFLEKYINKNMKVFEFGSGNSTLFFGKKVQKVVSVEHDLEWYEKISIISPKSVEIVYSELEYNGDYCRMIRNYNEKFDIIFIDGRDRVNCLKNSIDYLNDNGIIILDDSERSKYQEAFSFMKIKGFYSFTIYGISAGIFEFHETTVFYRNGFNINE
jgi:hypothetical protein